MHVAKTDKSRYDGYCKGILQSIGACRTVGFGEARSQRLCQEDGGLRPLHRARSCCEGQLDKVPNQPGGTAIGCKDGDESSIRPQPQACTDVFHYPGPEE